MAKDKFVGNLVKINHNNFKAFAIVVNLDNTMKEHGILYECHVIYSTQYEYERMPIFVKENALENAFNETTNIASDLL